MRISDWSSDVCSSDLELRVARQPEGLAAMRLQAEGRPDPPDRRVGQPALLGHRTDRPVGRVVRRRPERALDHRRHLSVLDRARPARARLVDKAVEALRQEATAPFADRVLMQAEVSSEEHTSELQSLLRISYAVFRLQKKTTKQAK